MEKLLNKAHKDVISDLLQLCKEGKIDFKFRVGKDGVASFTYRDDINCRVYNVFRSGVSKIPALASRSDDESISQTFMIGEEVEELYGCLLSTHRDTEAKEEVLEDQVAFDSLVSDLDDLVKRLSQNKK